MDMDKPICPTEEQSSSVSARSELHQVAAALIEAGQNRKIIRLIHLMAA